jgi:uncharacterized membrane protein (Fun14 family)
MDSRVSPMPDGAVLPSSGAGTWSGGRLMSAAGRIMLLWAIGVACAAILVAVNVVRLRTPETAARQLAQQAIPADLGLRDDALAILHGQTSFLAGLDTVDPAARGNAISDAQASGQTADALWTTYLGHALNRPGERALRQIYEGAAATGRRLGSVTK